MKSSMDIFLFGRCNFARPYIINVGELPLAIWKNPVTKQLSSVITPTKKKNGTSFLLQRL
jgi:hypothetical protein